LFLNFGDVTLTFINHTHRLSESLMPYVTDLMRTEILLG